MPPSKFCDCREDGLCPRYSREMRGRFREICAGVNCDLGTAAAFREQWAREADEVRLAAVPKSLLLITDQAPGDTVAMTAAVYSLHRAHPGKYLTAIQSPHPEVWEHNPDVDLHPAPIPAELRMHYPAIHQSNTRGIHFMQGWCEFLGMALGVPVPLLTNRPRLYFGTTTPPVGNFWLICSGGKRDLTNKIWPHDYFEEVVALLDGQVRFIQVGNNTEEQPPLRGVSRYAVGETSLRHLFALARRARGVVCGVSLLMHVAAALEKPAIVIAGGREPVAWNAYPRQQYLHTVGALPCVTAQGETGACWRSRVVPLGDGTPLDEHPCLRVVEGFPECMRLISPAEVAGLVARYNMQYRSCITSPRME